jgi:hypothetical protein
VYILDCVAQEACSKYEWYGKLVVERSVSSLQVVRINGDRDGEAHAALQLTRFVVVNEQTREVQSAGSGPTFATLTGPCM